ncbi:MAG: glycosyltransferase family 9 protein [Elusimicrobiota bacterium]|nr:glycosyltransferase family 9 protein [Endomicrobiia bacterium]MDW8056215.1 glycosyltransferase family 9 protein [Elusimicrobiota bacterium]
MKITVFHLNQLGDMLFSLPLLYNLRKVFNNAKIVSICSSLDLLKFIYQTTNLIDDFIVRPRDLKVKHKLSFIKRVMSEKFDISIHLSQSLDATLTAFICGIPHRVGFKTAAMSFLYTQKVEFIPPPSVYNNLAILESLKIPIFKRDYVGLISINTTTDTFKKFNITNNDFIVGISPATSKRRKYKMWSNKKFAEVIEYFIKHYSVKCFLLGSLNDFHVCLDIVNNININTFKNIVNLAGKTTLLEVACILKRTNIFIGVDSGLLHLASSFEVPVVGLFGKTLPEYIGPQGKNKIVIKKDNIQEITSEEVIKAAELLLGKQL